MTLLGFTILGWIDVRQIRRSDGMLPGLGLAVFEALFFPVIAFSGLLGWGIYKLLELFLLATNPSQTEFGNPGQVTISVMTALLVLAADLNIVVLIWRRLNRSLARSVAAAPAKLIVDHVASSVAKQYAKPTVSKPVTIADPTRGSN